MTLDFSLYSQVGLSDQKKKTYLCREKYEIAVIFIFSSKE